MAGITIQNLDNRLKSRLRVQAAHHGRSLEEEAREILRTALSEEKPGKSNLAGAIRKQFVPLGGVDLPLPSPEVMGDPIDFDA